MADPAEKIPLSAGQRRRRAAVLAVIAGLLTALAGGFFVLILSVSFGVGVATEHVHAAQAVFTAFVVCGILMSLGGWRLTVGDARGYRPTIGAALAGCLLAAACIVAWIVREKRLDYSLMVFTVPLITYAAIAYILVDCPPGPASQRHRRDTDPLSDSLDDAGG